MGLWDYEGMRVVVSGGGGAGMGAAAVTELANLGAEIHVLDLKEPPVDVASYQAADLLDADATAEAIANVPGTIHALFNCAGLPGPPFSDLDTMTVNFLAMRGSNIGNSGGHPGSFTPLQKGVEIMSSLYRMPAAHFRAPATRRC